MERSLENVSTETTFLQTLMGHKNRKRARIGEYKGYATANYFILSSSFLVCAVKNEREEGERAELTTTKCELSLRDG